MRLERCWKFGLKLEPRMKIIKRILGTSTKKAMKIQGVVIIIGRIHWL